MKSKEEIFDNALKELEEIKEIISNQKLKYNNIIDFNLEDIKSFLIEAMKQDKILEIFKEQLHINVYIGYFNKTPMYFLKIMSCDIFITKEIYDKLKEWLENDK